MNRSDLIARNGCLTVIRPPAPPVKPAPGQPGSLSSYVPALPEVFVAILDDGRILEEGTPEAIFTAPQEERTQQFLQRVIEARRL